MIAVNARMVAGSEPLNASVSGTCVICNKKPDLLCTSSTDSLFRLTGDRLPVAIGFLFAGGATGKAKLLFSVPLARHSG